MSISDGPAPDLQAEESVVFLFRSCDGLFNEGVAYGAIAWAGLSKAKISSGILFHPVEFPRSTDPPEQSIWAIGIHFRGMHSNDQFR